jgi:hypothetical protein
VGEHQRRPGILFVLLLAACPRAPATPPAGAAPPVDAAGPGPSDPIDAVLREAPDLGVSAETPAPPTAADAAVAIDAAAPAGDCPAGRQLVWRLDLGDPRWNQGPAAIQALTAELGYKDVVSGPEHASVVVDPVHGNTLQVLYAAGSGSNPCVDSKECTSVGGLAFRLPLPGGSAITSAVLSYWLKIEPTFQWVKGGKLPGLCGNDCSTGGDAVFPDRFSIRYMWRGGPAAEVYSYLTNPPNSGYGLDMGLGKWHWQNDGQWHRVQEELILNSAANKDGIIRVWYDTPTTAPPVFEEKDLTYYDRVKFPALGIDTFIFSTFHGGHDRSWSPSKDAHAFFADFQVCR